MARTSKKQDPEPAPDRVRLRQLAERMQLQVTVLGHLFPLRNPMGASDDEMTRPQASTLILLALHPNLPMSKVAGFLHCTGATCTGIADRLERDGFVERVRSETDRRQIALRLTGKGEKQAARLREQMVERLEQALELLDEADRETQIEILDRATTAALARVHQHKGPSGLG